MHPFSLIPARYANKSQRKIVYMEERIEGGGSYQKYLQKSDEI